MRQRTHQPQFAWLIFILLNFVNLPRGIPGCNSTGRVPFVVSPLFFVTFVLFVGKSLLPQRIWIPFFHFTHDLIKPFSHYYGTIEIDNGKQAKI